MVDDKQIQQISSEVTVRRATPYCPPMSGLANTVSVEEFNRRQKEVELLQSKVSAFQMELQKKDEEIAVLQKRLRENEAAQKKLQEMVATINEQMSAMALNDDLTKLRKQQKTQGGQIFGVQGQNMALQQQVQRLDERLRLVGNRQDAIDDMFRSLQHQFDVLRQKDMEEEASAAADLTVKQEEHKEDIAEVTVPEVEKEQDDSIQSYMQPATVVEPCREPKQPEQLPLDSSKTESEMEVRNVHFALIKAPDSDEDAVPLECNVTVGHHFTLGELLRIEQWKAELPVVYVASISGEHKQRKECKQKNKKHKRTSII